MDESQAEGHVHFDKFYELDQGGLDAVLLVDPADQKLVLDFRKRLSFLVMTKAEALAFAQALIEKAKTLK